MSPLRNWLRGSWEAVVEKARQGSRWYELDRRRYVWSAILGALVLASLFWVCQARPRQDQAGVIQPHVERKESPKESPKVTIYAPFLPSGVETPGIGPSVALAPRPDTPTPTRTPTLVPTATPFPIPKATATRTPVPPTPTATPFPGRITKVTKMGVGVYTSGGGFLVEAIYRLRPTVILLMDPTQDFAKEVRSWFPKAFIAGRRFVKEQPLDNPEQRGRAFADHVAELAVPLKGVVDAWMSYNEVTDGGNHDNYRAYNVFQSAFAQRLQGAYGIAAVAANDAAGTIQPEEYPQFFREAIESSQYFGVHAYAPQGANNMKADAEYYALRYRLIHAALAKAGVKHGPFVLTETGLWEGWRGYLSEESMAREFMWLSDEMDKDDYVLGQAIFGIFDRDEWSSFDILGTTVPDRLGKYREPMK